MKNKHNQNVGSNIERSDDRIDSTGEVFTPLELCELMVNRIPLDTLKDPESTFIDPAAGNGNFMIALRDRLKEYHSEDYILNNMLYAIELMEDNHQEMCDRLGISVDHPHYVCANALEYDYSFGEPVGLETFML
tara:strand:- start:82 stop:483 length:402 start_codon:yes stop_codon:yes gene_type:complete